MQTGAWDAPNSPPSRKAETSAVRGRTGARKRRGGAPQRVSAARPRSTQTRRASRLCQVVAFASKHMPSACYPPVSSLAGRRTWPTPDRPASSIGRRERNRGCRREAAAKPGWYHGRTVLPSLVVRGISGDRGREAFCFCGSTAILQQALPGGGPSRHTAQRPRKLRAGRPQAVRRPPAGCGPAAHWQRASCAGWSRRRRPHSAAAPEGLSGCQVPALREGGVRDGPRESHVDSGRSTMKH